MLIDQIDQGKHMFFNSIVKMEAIFLGIIEPAHLHELIITEIFKARVPCQLVPALNELAIKFVQYFFILKPAILNLSKHLFPQGTVGIFQKLHGLLQGVFLIIYGNRHLSGYGAELLCQHT